MWSPTDDCLVPGNPATRHSPSAISLVFVVLAGIGCVAVLGQVIMLGVASRATGSHAFWPIIGALLINFVGYAVYLRHHNRCHPWSGFLLFMAASIVAYVALAYALIAGLAIAATEIVDALPPPAGDNSGGATSVAGGGVPKAVDATSPPKMIAERLLDRFQKGPDWPRSFTTADRRVWRYDPGAKRMLAVAWDEGLTLPRTVLALASPNPDPLGQPRLRITVQTRPAVIDGGPAPKPGDVGVLGLRDRALVVDVTPNLTTTGYDWDVEDASEDRFYLSRSVGESTDKGLVVRSLRIAHIGAGELTVNETGTPFSVYEFPGQSIARNTNLASDGLVTSTEAKPCGIVPGRHWHWHPDLRRAKRRGCSAPRWFQRIDFFF